MADKRIERIKVENISKIFNIGFRKKEGFLFRIFSWISGVDNKKNIKVLDNISFSAFAGESLGIIGRNGSGKSTLLRVIAGIYSHEEGNVKNNGKLIYLNGFGQGLKPKLTMRDNIFLMGSIMGLSQNDIKNRFKEIVEFSGLNEFVDTKVYQFSSGMIARLNFSIALHCLKHQNPDILLLDEVMAGGGDIDFQSKAIQKIRELIDNGTTVILVSHSLEDIRKYCDRVLLLDKGRIIKLGKPVEIIDFYSKNYNSLS